MSLEFKDLIDSCQAMAIANKMAPTEVSTWMFFCREYSMKFHTPLHLVVDLDPEFVILNVYETQLDKVDTDEYKNLEELLDTVMSLENPEYERKKKEEQDEFDKKAELEEEERIKSGKPIHPSLAKKNSEKKLLEKSEKEKEKEKENKPTGGFIDLSYLEKSENEG